MSLHSTSMLKLDICSCHVHNRFGIKPYAFGFQLLCSAPRPSWPGATSPHQLHAVLAEERGVERGLLRRQICRSPKRHDSSQLDANASEYIASAWLLRCWLSDFELPRGRAGQTGRLLPRWPSTEDIVLLFAVWAASLELKNLRYIKSRSRITPLQRDSHPPYRHMDCFTLYYGEHPTLRTWWGSVLSLDRGKHEMQSLKFTFHVQSTDAIANVTTMAVKNHVIVTVYPAAEYVYENYVT